jgi:hypothetical protein
LIIGSIFALAFVAGGYIFRIDEIVNVIQRVARKP